MYKLKKDQITIVIEKLYLDWKKFGFNPSLINVVRDPVQRFISWESANVVLKNDLKVNYLSTYSLNLNIKRFRDFQIHESKESAEF